MKVGELIKILSQFDPDKRVLIQAGEDILRPCKVRPLVKEGYRYYATESSLGDIVMNAVSN